MPDTPKISTLKEAKAQGCMIQRLYLDTTPDKRGRMRFVYHFCKENGELLGISKIITQKASSLTWRNNHAYFVGADRKLHCITRPR